MKDAEILKLFKDLLKIPSVSSDIPELEKIIDYVENYFSENTNAHIQRYTFNSKPSIIIQNFKGLESDIILNGHLDVVPAIEEWQFDIIEDDQKIFARGSGDMKSWVAVMMVIMKEILEKKYTEKKVCLMITTDEELGWWDGVKKIVELWYTANSCVLIPDSGSVSEITIAEKGIINLEVSVTWKPSHSSRPWLGDNAINKTMSLYKKLKEEFEETDKLTPSNDYWGSTVELTMISWGIATNTIPDNVYAHFNIRITETYKDTDKFLQDIKDIVTQYDWTVDSVMLWELLYTPEKLDVVQRYLQIAKKYTWNNDIKLIREHGASDGRFFAKKWIPVILQRPDTEFIHMAGEYVVKQAIQDIYHIYRWFIFDK